MCKLTMFYHLTLSIALSLVCTSANLTYSNCCFNGLLVLALESREKSDVHMLYCMKSRLL